MRATRAWAAVSGLAGAALLVAACGAGDRKVDVASTVPLTSATTAAPTTTTSTTATPATTTTVAPSTTTVPAPSFTRPGWIAAENAKPGTDAWRIADPDPFGWIEGYASATSATIGSTVTLFVDTGSPSYVVEAYRMGFYGGAQGRLVWTSPRQTGARQPAPYVDPTTGFAEARWTASLDVRIDDTWPPGSYLLKLVSSADGASYVPLTVRADATAASLLFVSAVTTWQAYNQWGGCSFYSCGGLKGRDRAVKVSFDRPIARQFNDGAADYLYHELPLVALAEELGLDVAYATDLDLHEHPDIAGRATGLLSTGHDEYYSTAMRQALVAARDKGVNLAFFGANAVYRHIRFESSSSGRANRVMVNYRSADDPIGKTDPSEVTVEWRLKQRPEAELVGVQYLCAHLDADLVVSNAAHWIWSGAGVVDGQRLPSLVGNEADGWAPSSPANLDQLARSPVPCGVKGGGEVHQVTGYHSTPAGGGVFASGTLWWVCALEARYCSVPANIAPVRAATANVLRAFAAGPAGLVHPSGTPGGTSGS